MFVYIYIGVDEWNIQKLFAPGGGEQREGKEVNSIFLMSTKGQSGEATKEATKSVRPKSVP